MNPDHSKRFAGALMCLAALPAFSATLQHSVFQENMLAESGLFHEFGRDDFLPEAFARDEIIPGKAAARGQVRTAGGALPRAEGSMTVDSLTNTTGRLYGTFYARIYYEWTVERVGPGADDPVPIDVHVRGGVDSTVPSSWNMEHLYAQAEIELPDTGRPSEYHLARGCVGPVCTPGPISFDDRFSGWAQPGAVYNVTLQVRGAGSDSVDGGPLSFSAWVDPAITISSAFARRDDFRLVFSAGIAPIPEPSSLLLMSAGLGVVLAFAMRRQRRPSAHSAP